MAYLSTVTNANGGTDTNVYNPNGQLEAQLITNADGTKTNYAWGGLAADATLQVTAGVLTVSATDTLGETYRLYQTILGRAPDNAGFNMWTPWMVATHGDINVAAGGFLNSAEYSATYGAPTSSTFAGEMYWNTLGHGYQAGEAIWASWLDAGNSRVTAAVSFAQSQEAINYTTGAFADFLYTDNPSGFAISGRSFAADGHLTQDAFSYLNGDTQNDFYLANGQLQAEWFQHAYGNLNAISYDYDGTQWWSRYESDYSATGQLLDNAANVTGGGSLIQTYSQSTVDAWWQKIDWFYGANGSGAWTKEMIDNRDGTSATIDTNPYHAAGYAWKLDNYIGASGTGSLSTEVVVRSDGTYAETDFSGANLLPALPSITTFHDIAGNVTNLSLGLNAGDILSADFMTGSIELISAGNISDLGMVSTNLTGGSFQAISGSMVKEIVDALVSLGRAAVDLIGKAMVADEMVTDAEKLLSRLLKSGGSSRDHSA